VRCLSRYWLQFRSVALNQSGIVVGQSVVVADHRDGVPPTPGVVERIEDYGTHVLVAIRHADRVAVWRFPGNGEGECLPEPAPVPVVAAPVASKGKK
jgi:hypothetical protein